MDRDTYVLLRFVQIVLLRDPLAAVETACSLLKHLFCFLREGGMRDLRMNSMRPI